MQSCRDCAPRWYNIGLRLGVKESVLRRITERDPVDCLREVLSQWLNRNILPNYPPPSWYILCKAIHEAGENPAVAESIAKKPRLSKLHVYLIHFTEVPATPLLPTGVTPVPPTPVLPTGVTPVPSTEGIPVPSTPTGAIHAPSTGAPPNVGMFYN